MKDKVHIVYTDNAGPSTAFIKSLYHIYSKTGCFFDRDKEEHSIALALEIKKEFNAEFVNDDNPRLIFDNENAKTLYLLKFS